MLTQQAAELEADLAQFCGTDIYKASPNQVTVRSRPQVRSDLSDNGWG